MDWSNSYDLYWDHKIPTTPPPHPSVNQSDLIGLLQQRIQELETALESANVKNKTSSVLGALLKVWNWPKQLLSLVTALAENPSADDLDVLADWLEERQKRQAAGVRRLASKTRKLQND